ncbi:MAG: HAD family hydrolase [Chloroflexota bacterium]
MHSLSIRSLIFDFDGLILDTETPSYLAWRELYRSYGFDLPMEKWGEIVGGTGASHFDPMTYLEDLAGRTLDREALRVQQWDREWELTAEQPLLPGVMDYLNTAQQLSLRLGIASSSDRAWVEGHLKRIGLFDQFAVVRTAEDVERTKPDPALFLSVLEGLEITAREAIAFEDSPNGVLAAKRAGLFCVAVPNPITAQLIFDEVDLSLTSLAAMKLEDLLKQVKGRF